MITVAPLSGVSVLELSSGLGGLAAGALLAQLGAEVVQAAPPDPPDPTDPVRIWADHLKSRLPASRRLTEGTMELRRRADAADVVLSDLPPGSLERLGLDAVTVLERTPTPSTPGCLRSGPLAGGATCGSTLSSCPP
jgi:itaconate CoA-transferase